MDSSVPGPVTPHVTDTLASEPQAHHLPIKFTGSGSEYFRIWIVNLLLMLLSLSVYYPWAKVRRLRYFHGNTLIDGKPLDFHGAPKKMLKGYLLVGLLFGLYSLAGNFSPTAGLVALAIVVAIWPALMKSSMQFRLANTSWCGMRFRFKGSLGGAYWALLPMTLPIVAFVGATVAMPVNGKPTLEHGVAFGIVMLLNLAALPWLFWNLKRYQHNHYALASLQTTFNATVGFFYKVLFKGLGVVVLLMVLPLALSFGLIEVSKGSESRGPFIALIAGLFPLLFMLLVFVTIKPYMTSRIQNLIWTRTGNTSVRFLSHLRFSPLFRLTLKNWGLMIVTLGLYWPFAAVALTRMRLEAVTVKTRIDPDELVNLISAVEGDAAGDAAGDLFDLDIGL